MIFPQAQWPMTADHIKHGIGVFGATLLTGTVVTVSYAAYLFAPIVCVQLWPASRIWRQYIRANYDFWLRFAPVWLIQAALSRLTLVGCAFVLLYFPIALAQHSVVLHVISQTHQLGWLLAFRWLAQVCAVLCLSVFQIMVIVADNAGVNAGMMDICATVTNRPPAKCAQMGR